MQSTTPGVSALRSQDSFDPTEPSVNPKAQLAAACGALEDLAGIDAYTSYSTGGSALMHRTHMGGDGSSSIVTPEHTHCSATSCTSHRTGINSFPKTRQTWDQTPGLGLHIANNSCAGNWLRHSCAFHEIIPH